MKPFNFADLEAMHDELIKSANYEWTFVPSPEAVHDVRAALHAMAKQEAENIFDLVALDVAIIRMSDAQAFELFASLFL